MRGRRVLENARAKKRRFDPLRGQRRNFGKLSRGNRCADQRWVSGVIVAARRNHCRCATVLDAIRVCVKALVQLRGRTQRKRPEKRSGDANRNKRPLVIC